MQPQILIVVTCVIIGLAAVIGFVIRFIMQDAADDLQQVVASLAGRCAKQNDSYGIPSLEPF